MSRRPPSRMANWSTCRCGWLELHNLLLEKTISIDKPRESVGGFGGKVLARPTFAVTAATIASRMSSSAMPCFRHALISDSIFLASGRRLSRIFLRSSMPSGVLLPYSRSASHGDSARKQTSGCVSRNLNPSFFMCAGHCRKSSTSAIFEAIAQVCSDMGPPVILQLSSSPAFLPASWSAHFLYASIACRHGTLKTLLCLSPTNRLACLSHSLSSLLSLNPIGISMSATSAFRSCIIW